MNVTEDALAVTIPWLIDGIVIGIGALVGMKIDEIIADADAEDADAE